MLVERTLVALSRHEADWGEHEHVGIQYYKPWLVMSRKRLGKEWL